MLKTHSSHGSTFYEVIIATTLASFLLLELSAFQAKTMRQLSQSTQRFADYRDLHQWQPADLSLEACTARRNSAPQQVLECTKRDDLLNKEIKTLFIVN